MPSDSAIRTTTGFRRENSKPSPKPRNPSKRKNRKCFLKFTEKLEKRRKDLIEKEMQVVGIRNMTVENTLKPIRSQINRVLYNVFPENMQKTREFIMLERELQMIKDSEIISTFTYLKWEKEFIDIVKEEAMNPFSLIQFESKRFSENLLEKVSGNIFVKLTQTYDYQITTQYYDEIVTILMLTHKKCETL